MFPRRNPLLMVLALLSPAAAAVQQAPATLAAAAQMAVAENPAVEARWHAFKASREEQRAARGGYLPQLDLNASVGREWRERPDVDERDFSRRGAALTLSQMLYDGFATNAEVARLGQQSVARYYELLDAAESTALEAVRAHHDVLRYRALVTLAKDNYVQHRQIFDQIEQRVRAGVGRRVDLEQASGRLALAESNLLTESSNLHDVRSRYQRIVGVVPAAELDAGELPPTGLPGSVNQALAQAYAGNPGLAASRAVLRSAAAEARGKTAGYHPRLDLRASEQVGHDIDGIDGRQRDRVIELVFNVNLFRGGADSARVRQFAEQLNVARDLRDKTCRDLRQTLAIAFNDIGRLGEQLAYLDQHQLSIAKAREAYRRQFDIGQRTLLDLLDTENEYFEARRAYVIAEHDLAIAKGRTLASMGRLLQALGLSRDGLPSLDSLGEPTEGADAPTACPAEAPLPERIDKAALLAAAAPRLAAHPQAVVVPAAGAASDGRVEERLRGWAAAWSAGDAEAYLAFYAAGFVPGEGQSRSAWEAKRRRLLAKPGGISIGVEQLELSRPAADRVLARFRQRYESYDFSDVVDKALVWVREGGEWRIDAERVR